MKMQIRRNKTTTTITLILALTITATLVAMPQVIAHDPAWNIPTATYLSVTPNPVGVGQEVIITFMLHMPSPTAEGGYGDRGFFRHADG